MTKVITCTAALILYERGLFTLNDPLEEYLPEFKNPQVYHQTPNGNMYIAPAKRSILVKDLFTMTSGLTYGGNQKESERQTSKVMEELRHKKADGEKYDVRTLSKALAKIPLAFEPGTHWRYSLSHDVLGAFIEVVSGKSFVVSFEEEIFEPLGMEDTFFRIPRKER